MPLGRVAFRLAEEVKFSLKRPLGIGYCLESVFRVKGEPDAGGSANLARSDQAVVTHADFGGKVVRVGGAGKKVGLDIDLAFEHDAHAAGLDGQAGPGIGIGEFGITGERAAIVIDLGAEGGDVAVLAEIAGEIDAGEKSRIGTFHGIDLDLATADDHEKVVLCSAGVKDQPVELGAAGDARSGCSHSGISGLKKASAGMAAKIWCCRPRLPARQCW